MVTLRTYAEAAKLIMGSRNESDKPRVENSPVASPDPEVSYPSEGPNEYRPPHSSRSQNLLIQLSAAEAEAWGF